MAVLSTQQNSKKDPDLPMFAQSLIWKHRYPIDFQKTSGAVHELRNANLEVFGNPLTPSVTPLCPKPYVIA